LSEPNESDSKQNNPVGYVLVMNRFTLGLWHRKKSQVHGRVLKKRILWNINNLAKTNFGFSFEINELLKTYLRENQQLERPILGGLRCKGANICSSMTLALQACTVSLAWWCRKSA